MAGQHIAIAGDEVSAVRRTIEERALEVFSRKGYHAASIREIVEAAHVTAPTLYYHFGSKEGLFRHLVEQFSERLRQGVEQAAQSPGGIRGQLLALVGRHLASLRENPAQIRFFHRVVLGQIAHEGQPQGSLEYRHQEQNALRQLFLEAISRGELREERVELLMNAFLGALSMHVIQRILPLFPGQERPEPGMPEEREACTEDQHGSDAADAERIVDLFLAGAGREQTKEKP